MWKINAVDFHVYHSLFTGFVESLCHVMATASPQYWVFYFTGVSQSPMILDNRQIDMLETWISFKWQPLPATSVPSCFHSWGFAVLLSNSLIAVFTLQFLWSLSSSGVQWYTELYTHPFHKTDPSCLGYSPFPEVSNGKLWACISQGLFPAAVQRL